MATLDINDELRAFAETQAARQGFANAREYVEALLKQARQNAGDEQNGPGGAASDFYATHTLEQMAAEQGVRPIERFEDLLGNFWPENEAVDDFVAAVREWRARGVGPVRP